MLGSCHYTFRLGALEHLACELTIIQIRHANYSSSIIG
jgi:hypothetical protein